VVHRTHTDFLANGMVPATEGQSAFPHSPWNRTEPRIGGGGKPYDFGADKLKATKAPMFFIHGDADGLRLEHISEMFRLKDDEIFGDMRPRSASRLAVLPNTRHATLI
jgi:hypothetical protein